MSITMVGEETEIITLHDATDRSPKETKKCGLINSFFKPVVKSKENTESKSETETSASVRSDDDGNKKGNAEIILESNQSGLFEQKEKCSNSKSYPDNNLSSQEDRVSVKSKQTKAKSSVTCTVQNTSKLLSSSGSEFEDDGKSLLTAKTKERQKSRKKKEKAGKESEFGTQEVEGKIFVDDGEKAVKKTRTSVKKGKRCTGTGSNCTSSSEQSGQENNKSVGVKEKESRSVGNYQAKDSNKASLEPAFDQTGQNNGENESKDALSSKETTVVRTSAFDVLMKSQRAQKTDSHSTESTLSEALQSDATPCDAVEDNSCSCEITDVKENLQSKETVSCQSKSLMEESSPDKIEIGSSHRTNAFDFLMKKGKFVNSPCGEDSQAEMELESDATGNVEHSLKKKLKKKTFEFQLRICASNKKDIEISFESESVSADTCQEKAQEKSKKKKRKNKNDSKSAGNGERDHSFVNEKSDEGDFCKSKKVAKKSKVKSKVKSKQDSADVSLLEEHSEEESRNEAQKKKRRSGRKSASSVVAMDLDSNHADDTEEFEPAAKNNRKKANPKGSNEENHGDIKGNSRRKRKAKRNDANTSKKTEEKIELETASGHQRETSISTDPKPLAAIFLKKPAVSSKAEITEENQAIGSTYKSASSSLTCPSNFSADAKDKQTVDAEPPQNKQKSAEEREAANRAFKALFTGPSSQKASPSVNAVEALPVDKELSQTSGKSTKQSFDKESTQSKEKSAEEKEAANRAFKALFTGASSQKTATSVGVVEACPAPWPSISHVLQKDEDFSSNESFWCLPWPVGKDCKFDVSLHCHFLLECPLDNALYSPSPLIMQNKVLSDAGHSLGNSPHMEKKREQPSFPEAVIKKILSELALFYPGVPLRKLYKRYASKLEKYKASIESGENMQLALERKELKDDVKKGEKLLESKEDLQEVNIKSPPCKRGRGRQRLSSDGGVGQEKKMARKSGNFCATIRCKDQGLVGDQSARTSCKKRQREEDKDHQEKACKGRRLSTRLQEKKQTCAEDKTVDNNLPQKLQMRSNKKKRRRTADCDSVVTEIHVVSKEQLTCAIPSAPTDSKSDKTVSILNDVLWTDLYRPVHSTEVMANASAVSKLRSWLEEWKIKREKTLRRELQQQKRLLAKQKSKASSSQTSSQTLEWWDADSDSDFQMSDGDSDDSDTEGIGLSTAMFISGPSGAGKTAIVYACAEELGYKVFEVNSASKRSGKHILSQLEEATQSHLVINNKPITTIKGPVPESTFAGLFSKPEANSSSSSGPLGALFQQAGKASKSKEKKGVKGSKGKSVKEKQEKSRAKAKSILKQPSQSPSQDGTESNLSCKAASLILFEEVDVIFEEDKSFWMAVNSFMQNAKCPIVLISTESQVSCEGKYDQINVKCPSVNLLSAHLQLVGLMNNMFINPGDLKSLVAHNNYDIRRSFLNLQFWLASGGGLKMPYKRPANLNDSSRISDKNQTTKTSGLARSAACVQTNSLSQDVSQSHPTMTGGVLDEGGEESMFLSLSDWQVIKSGGLRRSSRSSRSGTLKPTEADNSDSDFCEPKRKTLVCADGSTDSIFEITDTNDSQPVNGGKRPDDSVQLPFMDGLLFESVLGLMNCLQQPAEGSLSALQKGAKLQDELQVRNILEKLHLAHFSQVLGVNLTHANLSSLLPFFVDPSVSQQKEEVPDQSETKESKNAPSDIAKDVTTKGENMFSGIFSDTSLFDDGTESPIKITEIKEGLEKGPEKGLIEANKNASSSQDSTDTGFSESQTKEETGESGEGQNHEMKADTAVKKGSKLVRPKPSQDEQLTSQALEMFAQCAENMSFADAYCPSLSNTQSFSARFGWWGAHLKPGLTDEHVTVEESRDWLTCDTRSSIRGALEVANLDDCFVKVKSSSEDLTETGNKPVEEITGDQTSTRKSVLCDLNRLSEDFPPRDLNSLVRLDAVTQAQKSSTATRRKLYSSLSSCIPVINHCNHCSVVCDYIPTFRLLCHSERLREAAHIKRRFLHYLDSNSFPISRATMDALADSYMVS